MKCLFLGGFGDQKSTWRLHAEQIVKTVTCPGGIHLGLGIGAV